MKQKEQKRNQRKRIQTLIESGH